MSGRIWTHRGLAGVLVALLLAGCGDLLYETPAPAGPPAVVVLNVQSAAAPQAVDPGVSAAFARVGQLQIVVSGGGETVTETFAVSGSSGEIRASIEVPVESESQRVSIQVELRGGGGPLFRGQAEATLTPGQTASPEIELSSVVGRIGFEPAAPPALTSLGATIQLQARALFSTGDPIEGIEFAWTSRDPTVATVSSTGVVTAVGEGTARIQAQGGGATGEVPVRVEPVAASVEVVPASLELPVGGESTLQAVVRDAGGAQMTAEVEWSSAAPAVATVSASGQVRGVAPGQTVVRARVGEVSAEATVQVAPRSPRVETGTASGIQPNRAFLTGQVNPFGLSTDAWFEWGREPGLSDARTTPRTPVGDGVSFVEVIREITGLGEDSPYYVRLVAENELGTTRGEIRPFRTTLFPVAVVQVRPSEVTLEPGGTARFTAEARAGDGTVLQRSFTWTSSDDGVARVGGDGTVEGVSPGESWVRAEVLGVSDSARVLVLAGPPDVETRSAVELTPTGATLRGTVNPGGFQAQARFQWGRAPDLTDARTTDVQIVDGGASPSLVSARLEGLDRLATYYFRVVASNEAGSAQGEILSFRTPDVPVDRIQVTPDEATLQIGATRRFSAQVLDADGNTLDRAVQWTTSSASIASVSGAGVVTGVSVGTAEIRAIVDGVVGRAQVEVVPGPPAAETLGAEDVDNESAVLRARVDGGGLGVRVRFEWSEDPGLSEPNVTEEQEVEAGAGEVTVRRSLAGLQPGTRYYFRVAAQSDAGTSRGEILSFATQGAPVTRVGVSPGESVLNPGDTVRLTATAFDAEDNALDRDVTWTSVEAGVATVSNTGLVTAVAIGTTEIRASVDGIVGTAAVQVAARAPTASTLAATGIESGAATLRGEVDGGGLGARVFFRYGTDPALQDVLTVGAGEVPPGSGSTIVSQAVTDLAPDTRYWYEIVAVTSAGEAEGGARDFRTAPIPVDRIEVDPSSAVLSPGQTVQIEAVPVSADGEPLERELGWRSTDESVATVTQTGLVEGRAEGSAAIQVAANGVSAEVRIEVRAGAPVVRTLEANRIGERSAILRGEVNPGGGDSRVIFQWGTDPRLERFETLVPPEGSVVPVTGGTVVVEAPLEGLTGATAYYYRIVAGNEFGESLGEIIGFETELDLPTPILREVYFEDFREFIELGIRFSGYNPDAHPDAEFFLQARRNGDTNWNNSQTVGPFTFTDNSALQQINLTAGIAYDFRMRARRQGRFSEYSNVETAVPPGFQPAAQQRFPAVHSADLSQVTLSGVILDGGWEAEWVFEFSTDPEMTSILAQTPLRTISRQDLLVLDAAADEGGELGRLTSRQHEVEETVGSGDSWLREGLTVYYRPVVRIPGDPESANRSAQIYSFTYGQPTSAPAQLEASFSTAANGIVVNGVPPFEPNAGFLEVERRVNGGAWQFRATLQSFASTISYIDTAVQSGRTYQYRIRGCRPNGGCSMFGESNVVDLR